MSPRRRAAIEICRRLECDNDGPRAKRLELKINQRRNLSGIRSASTIAFCLSFTMAFGRVFSAASYATLATPLFLAAARTRLEHKTWTVRIRHHEPNRRAILVWVGRFRRRNPRREA